MVALGVDPTRFLTTDDDTERLVWLAITQRAAVHRDRLDENLSARIANAVGRLLK